MSKTNQKTASNFVSKAIASSKDNYDNLLNALAYGMAFAAEHGRFEPLQELFQKVSEPDHEACRQWLMNLMRKHGVSVTNEAGREMMKSFFLYKTREKTFMMDKAKAHYTEARAKIADLSVDELRKVVLGKENRSTENVESVFTTENFEDALSRLLKRALVSGAKSEAEIEQFNKLIDAGKRVEKSKILADAQKAAEAQEKRAELARARLLTLTGNGKAEDQAEQKADNPPVAQAA